ncbi:Uma2 family endonuclease [Sorangium sp. So ce1024]|jgi:Uma2 family endonuclease|uniref:Uma2 family endonuclease n=1 Tax=Sorangium sp. So ce1024 TaxID=3133327 RepID=UPI003F060208
MGVAAPRRKLSPEEYLELDRASEVRHEYAGGEIFAMSGGTFEHSAIAANIGRLLGNALGERGCTALNSELRIKIPSADRYVYPDGSVVCGRPEFEDERRDTLLNPVLVIEVLSATSDSSEAYDRGDKFALYQTVASIREVVLASQKAPRVEVFARQADGSWVLRVYGPGDRAALSSVGCDLVVDEVYRGVLAATGAGR